MNSKKILIFGVFDGIHSGHLHLINEAKKLGNHLVAVVARDRSVEELKGKTSIHNEVERIKNLLEIPEIDLVLLGDLEQGTYNILREVKPDIIYLGYDQVELQKDLNKKIKKGELPEIEIKICTAYKGEEMHSSILNKK